MNVNILNMLDHPQLFGPGFRGDTWRPWRCFLKALFALPMDDAELALYRHHTERQTAPVVPFREAALVVGRRGGKSRISSPLSLSFWPASATTHRSLRLARLRPLRSSQVTGGRPVASSASSVVCSMRSRRWRR